MKELEEPFEKDQIGLMNFYFYQIFFMYMYIYEYKNRAGTYSPGHFYEHIEYFSNIIHFLRGVGYWTQDFISGDCQELCQ